MISRQPLGITWWWLQQTSQGIRQVIMCWSTDHRCCKLLLSLPCKYCRCKCTFTLAALFAGAFFFCRRVPPAYFFFQGKQLHRRVK